MRLITALLLSLFIAAPLLAAPITAEQIAQELKQVEANKSMPSQPEIADALRSALNWQKELKDSTARAEQFQKTIDDFPTLTAELRQKLSEQREPITVKEGLNASEYEQQLLQSSSRLLELSRLLQQEQDNSREISESLNQIPLMQTEARKALSDAELRLQSLPSTGTPLSQAQLTQLQSEVAARKAKLAALELEQLSANNRQELSRLQADLYKQENEQADLYQQALRTNLNNQRQKEADYALAQTEKLAVQNGDLPSSVLTLLQNNRELSFALNQQAQRMEQITQQQREAASQTLKVRQALSTIREQAQWLSVSTVLGETLRAQVAKLPEMPKPQQLDNDMVELRVKRLHYEELLESLRNGAEFTQNNGSELTPEQQQLVDKQIKTQRALLSSLLSGCDTQILELTKLKVANSQLVEALIEIKDATHRYLFWVADVDPIGFSFPLSFARDLKSILSLDTLSQLSSASIMMITNKETLFPIFGALLLIIISVNSRRHYYAFLERSAHKVGKVTQDHFLLTLRNVFWSILVALPVPVLWATLGFGLQNAWPYPIAVAIGNGITATLPLLWVFMISASFAHPQGLFITHFRWSQERVSRVLRYYRLSIWLIVPLIMALISFDNFNDREYSATVGRVCFLLLCIAVFILTSSLRRSGIPLYLDRKGSGENIINHALWLMLLCAPVMSAIAASIGYLTTAQALLARLESSVAIWFILLVVYHIVRRWMLIQRRRIAFDRAKQRRADILAQRAKNEEDGISTNSNEGSQDIDEPVVDLDEISSQSLRLVRSILTMIALVSLIVLWSEIHSAFSFLENVRLWDVTKTVQGVEVPQPITLGSVLIAILVIVVTMQLVRNLPALLELAVLQHLELSPGSGYAFTTITKYILMLIGIMVGFSLLGIEWAKLQWLVAALGVGLGFGLQEIFANFISGLIILFEKPIRIGDTVTIRDLTGTITKINTRATTLSDWDRKEIIVPNKAFITEQFINWSLSDPITRVLLTVPAPAEADSNEVTQILLKAAHDCALVLDNPAPETFLIDLQQGIQIFELRLFASEMGHRMPIRHEMHQLILAGFREHGLTLPFPPFQVRTDSVTKKYNSIVNPPHVPGSL